MKNYSAEKSDYINYMKQRFPEYLYKGFNNRLSFLNQRSPQENTTTSIKLAAGFILASVIYLVVASYLINALWYHNILIISAAVLFFIILRESYFESQEKSIKENLPKLIRKILHYYTHYNKNIVAALQETEKRCPVNMRIFVIKIRMALESEDYEHDIDELKENMPSIWLKMLCVLMLIAKRQGVKDFEGDSSSIGYEKDPISLNLQKMIKMINFINIEQKQNTAKLIGYQIGCFLTPFVTLPVVSLYYSKLDKLMNLGNPYGDITAQTLAAVLLFSGNAGALYIHWLRKMQY
ncbi:MAG: hypothetical protein ACM3TR_01745 [Caulobacteraceae bacterium]